ncbi:hypothetical protein R5R35_014641 [Gryllus longicercus]|uniref:DNA topoisomerase I n=1 Tax=Gryllus longicercus TaxID=2509291 RepID=A0AAN9Z6Y6_9ORTH
MSVEISENNAGPEIAKISKENNPSLDRHSIVNGISNGYSEKHSKKEHKSDSKDKERHRDKDKHRDREGKESDRDKERRKEKSEKDKSKHSSSSSSSKDKDRDKERKHKDEKRDKEREKDREHKSSSSSKDKEHKSSSKDKEKHSSSSNSSSKDKDRDKHNSSHRDKDRDKDKERHSSSSKEKHSSSHDKERHSSSDKKHSDKHKSKEKDSRDKEKVKSKSDEHSKKEKDKPEEKSMLDSSDFEEKPKIKESFDEKSFVSIKTEVESPSKIKVEPEDTSSQYFNESVNDTMDSSIGQNTFHSELIIKSEEDTEDDTPLWPDGGKSQQSTLSLRPTLNSTKRSITDEDDDDDVPLFARKKVKKEKEGKKRKSIANEEEFKPAKKKSKNKDEKKVEVTESPKKKKKEEEQQDVWKWWEEEKKDDGKKWSFLEHKGPVFAPPYEPLPPDVKFSYNGKEMKLSEDAEEIATFYARMLDHDYTTKEAFNKNFFKDWRKSMTDEEKQIITDLAKCNFKQMHAYFVAKSEERKAMSKEEKKALKEKNEEVVQEFGFCMMDGHKEKIANFKIEPPGLFRGRGEHPKMGTLKKRVMPEDVIINCSKDSKVPKPPDGHKWKEVRHDQSVTWLASWIENVQGQVKYIMLNPSSKLKGEKDWQKYETARKLAKVIDKIRDDYREDWRSKEMRIRQRAVAMYFIDKLALRAGNEKDEDQADTVGCCSLRVEHIQLHEEKDGKEYVVVFDFLGKDSIRYYNEVAVEKRVFKNLQIFMQNKSTGDDLFDRLNTSVLNKHLSELMEGLTAKVFRTYNASITLQEQLKALTKPEYSLQEKILAYNRANRAVAILCNHQRAVPKTHAKSMENLKLKIETKKDQLEEAEKQYKEAKRESKRSDSAKVRMEVDKKKKALDRIRDQLQKLEVQATDREENKEIALGTSKLNYLDPRISVAWCKKNDIPIEKIYNKTQRDKFRWAIDMAGPDYIF